MPSTNKGGGYLPVLDAPCDFDLPDIALFNKNSMSPYARGNLPDEIAERAKSRGGGGGTMSSMRTTSSRAQSRQLQRGERAPRDPGMPPDLTPIHKHQTKDRPMTRQQHSTSAGRGPNHIMIYDDLKALSNGDSVCRVFGMPPGEIDEICCDVMAGRFLDSVGVSGRVPTETV